MVAHSDAGQLVRLPDVTVVGVARLHVLDPPLGRTDGEAHAGRPRRVPRKTHPPHLGGGVLGDPQALRGLGEEVEGREAVDLTGRVTGLRVDPLDPDAPILLRVGGGHLERQGVRPLLHHIDEEERGLGVVAAVPPEGGDADRPVASTVRPMRNHETLGREVLVPVGTSLPDHLARDLEGPVLDVPLLLGRGDGQLRLVDEVVLQHGLEVGGVGAEHHAGSGGGGGGVEGVDGARHDVLHFTLHAHFGVSDWGL